MHKVWGWIPPPTGTCTFSGVIFGMSKLACGQYSQLYSQGEFVIWPLASLPVVVQLVYDIHTLFYVACYLFCDYAK